MKIVGFQADAGRRLGVVSGDRVVDLQAVDAAIPSDLGAVLSRLNGDLAPLADVVKRAPAGAHRPLAGLSYAMPVERPGKIICLGLNYMDHVKEGTQNFNIPKYPTIFFRMLTSLVPHEAPVIRPRASVQFDYEGEMVAIVGRRARHLTTASALGCIAGYSCCNEGSVRDFQWHTTQWGMGKNFDRTGALGPWMVSADELPPGGTGLRLTTRINGQTMQSDSTENMMFPLAETLVYLTQAMTLEPGDVIITGTPSGVGFARKPPVWERPGDVCEVEIEGIGVLRNPVEDEKA